MASTASKGRWVILLGDDRAPVFWSVQRKTVDGLCRHLSRTCPTARVAWQAIPSFPKSVSGKATDDSDED